jgi:hypothetical protein
VGQRTLVVGVVAGMRSTRCGRFVERRGVGASSSTATRRRRGRGAAAARLQGRPRRERRGRRGVARGDAGGLRDGRRARSSTGALGGTGQDVRLVARGRAGGRAQAGARGGLTPSQRAPTRFAPCALVRRRRERRGERAGVKDLGRCAPSSRRRAQSRRGPLTPHERDQLFVRSTAARTSFSRSGFTLEEHVGRRLPLADELPSAARDARARPCRGRAREPATLEPPVGDLDQPLGDRGQRRAAERRPQPVAPDARARALAAFTSSCVQPSTSASASASALLVVERPVQSAGSAHASCRSLLRVGAADLDRLLEPHLGKERVEVRLPVFQRRVWPWKPSLPEAPERLARVGDGVPSRLKRNIGTSSAHST